MIISESVLLASALFALSCALAGVWWMTDCLIDKIQDTYWRWRFQRDVRIQERQHIAAAQQELDDIAAIMQVREAAQRRRQELNAIVWRR